MEFKSYQSRLSSRANTISTFMWEQHRDFIELTYIKQNRTIKQVLTALSTLGFRPTHRQLTTQIEKWGLRKSRKSALPSSDEKLPDTPDGTRSHHKKDGKLNDDELGPRPLRDNIQARDDVIQHVSSLEGPSRTSPQPIDWSTVPSSRNSIFPTMTVSAPPATHSTAVFDNTHFSKVTEDLDGSMNRLWASGSSGTFHDSEDHESNQRPDSQPHNNLAHFDLRPQNILISDEQGQSPRQWKLTDFGLSTFEGNSTKHRHDDQSSNQDIPRRPITEVRERSAESPDRLQFNSSQSALSPGHVADETQYRLQSLAALNELKFESPLKDPWLYMSPSRLDYDFTPEQTYNVQSLDQYREAQVAHHHKGVTMNMSSLDHSRHQQHDSLPFSNKTILQPLPGPDHNVTSTDVPSNHSTSTSEKSKKHKCPYCSTEFTRHHNLLSHLLTHSQERPYVCSTCQQRFRRLHDLKRHTKLHTGMQPHACDTCGRKFARGDALARHRKGPGGCAGRKSSVFSARSDEADKEEIMEGVVYGEPECTDEGNTARGSTQPHAESSTNLDSTGRENFHIPQTWLTRRIRSHSTVAREPSISDRDEEKQHTSSTLATVQSNVDLSSGGNGTDDPPETIAYAIEQRRESATSHWELETIDTSRQQEGEISWSQALLPRGSLDIQAASAPTDSGYASLTRDKLKYGVDEDGNAGAIEGRSDNDDTKTVYSDSASVETSQRDSFVDRLAELITQSLKDITISDTEGDGLFGELKDFLADFALRLGQESSAPQLRRAMAFIHKYRALVGNAFRNLLQRGTNEELEDDNRQNPTDNMPLGELMSRWFNEESAEPLTTAVQDLAILEDDIPLDDPILHDNPKELDIYSDLVSTSESYKWLTSKLRNQILLTHEDSHACSAIRREVLATIPKEVVVRAGTTSRTVRAVFSVEWPLKDFLRIQLESNSDSQSLGSIVSVTGSLPDVQAMTINDYLQQTWPTTGLHLLKIIEEGLNNVSLSAKVLRPDGAFLTVRFEKSTCTVSVSGSRDMVAELAEQLSWLAATLRSSWTSKDMITCFPILTCRKDEDPATLELHTSSTPFLLNSDGRNDKSRPQNSSDVSSRIDCVYICELTFEFARARLQSRDGVCWQHILPYCNIVSGFPVRRRSTTGQGMEISLQMMARFVGTKCVNQYRDTIFIRGFSAIYSPTQLLDGTITWHLTCNRTGGHVSYRDVPERVEHIGFADLEDKRHIVGWCTEVINKIGTEDIDCSVAESQLPLTKPGCVLDNFLLTFPKEILRGPTFALLKCQKSIHLTSATYRAKLKYLRDHFALLWDTEEDRGWLTNCLATFLHLTKNTFLTYDELTKAELMALWRRLLTIAWSISSDKPPTETAKCPLWLPGDSQQRTIYDKDDHSIADVAHQIFTRVCDQLFDGMEKLIDFQEQVEHDDSRRLRRSLRLLEGWSFHDLASEHGSKRARVLSLPTIAFPWAKLLRSLNTITIFGEQFGELLSPSEPCSELQHSTHPRSELLTRCGSLESKKFLVGVAMHDLQVKLRNFKHCAQTLMVGDSAILPRYASAFASCSRRAGKGSCAHGNKSILMPWPVAHRKLLPMTTSQCQCEVVCPKDFAGHYINGAIVLGHDDELGYHLDERGEPVKGKPPDPAVEQEEVFNDSGLGTDSSHASQENIASRVTSRSTDVLSAQNSGTFLKENGQSYKDSIVHGGAPVYGNIYVTNNNHHMLAASQTSYHGMRGTPDTPQHQISPAAQQIGWPNLINRNHLGLPLAEPSQYESTRATKRLLSYDPDSARLTKRMRGAMPVTDTTRSQGGTNRQFESTTPESDPMVTSEQSSPSSRPTSVDEVKRCCRCRTAMSVEKPTAECEECVHEFCIRCGILGIDQTLAYK